MILAIEPVFPNAHHAPGNAGVLRAIRLAAGTEDIAFAAHPLHRDAVFAVLGDAARTGYIHRDIEVLPAGGISLARFRSQARSMPRLVRELKPRLLVCLGTQPETLFACRLVLTVHRRLTAIAVLHGNLNNAAGWRSRDPRRRWFDDRSSIDAAAGEPRIQFVVLDDSVRDAALALGLLPPDRCHVWPLAIPDNEVWDHPHRLDPSRIRIAFLGSAKWAKGFGDFAAMTRRIAATGSRFEFSLVGSAQDRFPAEDVTHIEIPPGFLDRGTFLQRLRAVDYVCLPLRDDTYTLTVSGAILDAIAARKPLIALPTPVIRALFRDGPAGFLCETLAEMERTMGDFAALSDAAAYGRFQVALERACRARSPESLAAVAAPLIAA